MKTSMNKIESERLVEPFNGVYSSHGIDIQYTQSDVFSLKIKAKAKFLRRSAVSSICFSAGTS